MYCISCDKSSFIHKNPQTLICWNIDFTLNLQPKLVLLYSGYISRAFYFGEFGDLTKFAKLKPRQTPTLYSLYTLQYIELYRAQKLPNYNSAKFLICKLAKIRPLQFKALYSILNEVSVLYFICIFRVD